MNRHVVVEANSLWDAFQYRREQGINPRRALRDAVDELAARPTGLVVIDPEDREQVERLSALYGSGLRCADSPVSVLQAALREFANPAPLKPDEPTGLGAVVEDVEGERWVRVNVATGTQEWRCCDAIGEFRRWGGVNAVRVLSEGVTEA